MSNPIQSIGALLDRIGERADVEESAEWYLRSYLIDYKRALLRNSSSQEIEAATEALTRFCDRSLDVKSQLYRDCVEIAEQGRRWRGPGG